MLSLLCNTPYIIKRYHFHFTASYSRHIISWTPTQVYTCDGRPTEVTVDCTSAQSYISKRPPLMVLGDSGQLSTSASGTSKRCTFDYYTENCYYIDGKITISQNRQVSCTTQTDSNVFIYRSQTISVIDGEYEYIVTVI